MPQIYERRAVLGLLTAAAFAYSAVARAEGKPPVKVFKSPTCMCCTAWMDHLRAKGFSAVGVDTDNMRDVKARAGVPQDLASCHTAKVGRYVIEGHVPADAIERLLSQKPNAIGLAVPGMPAGSPGMEGGTPITYDVILFTHDRREVFGRYIADRLV